MESGLLLNVVVRKDPTVLKLPASEDESLLIERDSFLILDLVLYVLDGVAALDFEGNGLSSEGLDEYLVLSSEHRVERRLILDLVVGQSALLHEML